MLCECDGLCNECVCARVCCGVHVLRVALCATRVYRVCVFALSQLLVVLMCVMCVCVLGERVVCCVLLVRCVRV